MSEILNIAAYQFVPLDRLEERRQEMLRACRQEGFRGTILLSPEGMNLFLAGPLEPLRAWVKKLKTDPLFEELAVKESFSEKLPFNRMLVKIKREIISFGIEGIEPHRRTSPKLAPQALKQWLDSGRDVVLLDVRNDFEVQVGTFETAVPVGIDSFRQFSAAVDKLPEEYRDRPVVMFCTGGIRCEKAGPLMQRKGFKQIYQLDGGILKYFEEVGGQHYRGDCFVFDDRVAVGSKLEETGLGLCYACQAVLSVDEQQSPLFVEGKSCPRCFQDPEKVRQHTISMRHAEIAILAADLPGCKPHEQRRPVRIPERYDQLPLIEVLTSMFPQIDRETWLTTLSEGRITEGSLPVCGGRIVRTGEQFIHRVPEFIEPAVNAAIEILWEDDAIVVVNKPSPLPIHPSGRFNHNTLIGLLNRIYQPLVLRAAHRLDANTSGVTVLCQRRSVARPLQRQFETQQVEKEYLARCYGHPATDTFRCELPIGIREGAGRIRVNSTDGVPAITEFQVLQRDSDGTCQLRVKPITGRTNQIRVHLWELGYPIVGDPLYLQDHCLGENRALTINDSAMMLHARQVCFDHPETGERMCFTADQPPSPVNTNCLLNQ